MKLNGIAWTMDPKNWWKPFFKPSENSIDIKVHCGYCDASKFCYAGKLDCPFPYESKTTKESQYLVKKSDKKMKQAEKFLPDDFPSFI